MAEIQPKGDSGGGGKKRAKKMSTKIDMTPMVDLAFLLLTFFMLTTTFAKPNVMQLTMPVKEKLPDEEQTKIKASQAMTIILGPEDKVYYYFGLNTPNDPTVAKVDLQVTNYSATGIRKVIQDRQAAAGGVKEKLPIILIKPFVDRSKPDSPQAPLQKHGGHFG